jgi:hypothetical protein
MSCPPPTPSSLIPDTLAAERINLFVTGKYNIINDWLQTMRPGVDQPQSMTYTPTQFQYLYNLLLQVPGIAGVKVYFANYVPNPPVTDPYIPAGMEYFLTILFAATDGDMKDTGDYYVVDNSANPPTPSVKKFQDATIPLSWINYYQQNILPLLQADGQQSNPAFLETKTIFYTMEDLAGWISIINCSGQPGNPVINGVEWSFATYGPDEEYANQLGQVITLTALNTDSNARVKTLSGGGGGNYDTGSPCPPDDICN